MVQIHLQILRDLVLFLTDFFVSFFVLGCFTFNATQRIVLQGDDILSIFVMFIHNAQHLFFNYKSDPPMAMGLFNGFIYISMKKGT